MKKLVAIMLAASMSLSCAAVSAAGRTEKINEKLSNNDEIHILYNDSVVEYEDVKPVNTEGRVMIPFRAALENMGASVDYDDAQRKVTAKKGDVTINFTLMDDTIYIDENGQQSTITMDVPMIIIDDRTLVPIRFMSNAFGMQVGWDGSSETVVIMDYSDYFDNINELMPNMTKIMSLDMAKFNKSSSAFEGKFDASVNGASFNAAASGEINSTVADNAAGIDAAISFDGMGLSIKDAKIEAVTKDGQIYLKTDALSQIASSSDDASLAAASAILGSDTWYKIDTVKLISALGLPQQTEEILRAVLAMDNTSIDLAKILESGMQTEDDAEFANAMALAAELDMFEEMDKYISVTEKDDGGYTISMNIQTSDMINIIESALGSILTEDEKSALADSISFKAVANTDCSGTVCTSDADIEISVNAEDISYTLAFKVSETSEADANAETTEIPADCVDITDMLAGAVSQK